MQRVVKPVSRVLTSKPRPALAAQFVKKTTTPTRLLSSTSVKMGSVLPPSADTVLALVKNRRSIYTLDKKLPASLSTARIQEIVGEALQHVPSSFNSQSNRVVVLFGAEHERFWDIAAEALKAIVPADAWSTTEAKINAFRGAAGSILFYEDQAVVEGMQAKFPLYQDKFPTWATHSSAMLQFVLWTALEAEGLGANLQHYNPLVDAKVAEQWGVPLTWKLTAQLVFGGKTAEAGEKTFSPLEEKLKVFGA